MPPKDKQTIGRYELVRSLGRGSQGTVYLAVDPKLERRVAIKVLTATGDIQSRKSDGTALEGLVASKLNHPNIVPVFDAGEWAIGPYLVFEYVEGKSLRSTLADGGGLGMAAAAPIIMQILDAMAAAHAAGVLHLDLSPNNVLMDANGVARIMDFGLSQFVDFTVERTDTASGTLRYMSPEHFVGANYGPGTDVFALGSVCYEIVTGRHAMSASEVAAVQWQIVDSRPDLSALDTMEHGEAFAAFLRGALETAPEARYADAAAMRDAFSLFLANAGISASGDAGHSTIDFLMRRMQRKQDFPAISATLADINRLTGSDASASADQLANVILRDLALTNKLLKLVNSAFFGARAVEITSISEAVVFLGIEQVRMTANGLALLGGLKGDSAELKDAMIRALLSGLVARHLARRSGLACAEEAFICGLCQNLGEILTIYYFAEDYAEIESLRARRRLDKDAASRAILGVTYGDLGAAVARNWNLPATLVEAVRGLPAGDVVPSDGESERMLACSAFASELTDVFHRYGGSEVDAALDRLATRFAPVLPLDRPYLVKLANAGLEKLKLFSQHFELDVAKSRYCGNVSDWLDATLSAADATDRTAPAQGTG